MIISKQNKIEFIKAHIHIYTALYRGSVKNLRPREEEFLAFSVLIRANGIDLTSKEAVKELTSLMNFDNQNDVYVYRGRLKKKNWLLQTTDSIILPVFFDRFKTGIPETTKFKFALKWNQS